MASNYTTLPVPVNHQVYSRFAVSAAVTENDAVMNATDPNSGQAPLSFKRAVNNDYQYYKQIYGIAKNVNGGFADIFLGQGCVVPGFNFGTFVGVDYYLDAANPGKLTYNPPAGQTNVIKMGRALDATNLILDVYSQFVQDKGALYTSDGSGYDATILVGSNGNVLVANSAASTGQSWSPAVVASAPFTYTTATRTLTAATATNAVAGFLSAADHTTYSGYAATIALKAPLASPVFTGDVNASTGNILASTVGKGIQVKTGTNAKIGQAVLVAGTKVVANTSVTANSRVFMARSTVGGTLGHLSYSKIAATSFTILSSSNTETSTIDWLIVESIP